MSKRFPSNPYEDVTPSEFNKSNKKHASEYFIAENFKSYGWFVYEPFTDTGIDRIIEKKVCPENHTDFDYHCYVMFISHFHFHSTSIFLC